MPDGLTVLPRFRIASVEKRGDGRVLVRGRLEAWDGALERTGWFWLWTSEERAIRPELVDAGPGAGGAGTAGGARDVVVRLEAGSLPSPIAVGAALPWLHPRWSPHHVRMIRRGEWRLARVTTDGDAGVRCEVCRSVIGPHGFEGGYVTPDDLWLCPPCYHRWGRPRDLAFLRSR